ncbi:MAG TPA: hypothetical protein ENG69_05825 [Candidatus Korarchaeota archaeon]|nr:hypothetical protein [Candidatus Korarchaeota archaeon]
MEILSGRIFIRGITANVGDKAAEHVNVTVVEGVCAGSGVYLGSLDPEETLSFSVSCEESGEGNESLVRAYFQPALGEVSHTDAVVRIPATERELVTPETLTEREGVGKGVGVLQTAVVAVVAILVGVAIGRSWARSESVGT